MNSIKKKMFASVIFVILVAVITIGGVSSYLCYKATFDSLEKTMQEVAKKSSEVVSKEMDKYKTIAKEVGLISQLNSPDITLQEKNEIIKQRVNMHGLRNINTANKDGIAVSTNTGMTEVIKHTDYFNAAINGDVFISDAVFDGTTFEMYYIVSAPLWKNGIYGSKVEGIVMLEIEAKVISDIAAAVVVGEEGFGSIIDSKGYIIGHPDYKKALNRENTILKYEAEGSNGELAMLEQSMLDRSVNFGTYRNDGDKHLLSYAPIDGTSGWGMLVDVPQNEYMDRTYFSIVTTAVLALLSVILSAFVIFRVSAKIADPIIACANRLKLLSEGDLHTEVPKTRSKDETAALLNSLELTINEWNDVINDISDHISSITNGDFSREIHKEYIGDFEPMKKGITFIIDELNRIFITIGQSAEQVASGAQQVASGAQALTEGTTEQASSIEELAATINEMSQQIISNDKNAQEGKRIAENTADDVQDGTGHMNNMIDAMNDISSASVEISKIIKAIEDIAFQTNILALNAAVEAARAGSAGKGFAVVADEVRNLASKSAEAAQNTTNLIENSLRTIKAGSDIANVALKSFNSIVDKTGMTVSIVEEIAKASQQQALAASQITAGIDQISSVIQMNSATSEESAAASEELSGQAEFLSNLLKAVKLKGAHAESQTNNEEQPEPESVEV